ncbi:hypothetical protein [Paraburkholderia sp.]|nr:hypothetical protein [Paraburkholderia sp.]
MKQNEFDNMEDDWEVFFFSGGVLFSDGKWWSGARVGAIGNGLNTLLL